MVGKIKMSDILIEKNGHILQMGFNRPKKYNAFTMDMFHDLAKAYARLQNDPDLRVGLLYGVGDHMTAGLELDTWAPAFAAGEGLKINEGELDPFYVSGDYLKKPVVCAVQGYCYTVGVELLLNTDVRVAATDTRFAQLEVKRGFFACGGATLRLHENIGWGNAQRYLLTGDTWTAEQAYNWGMVQELTEPGKQFAAALAIAEKIAKAAPLGVMNSLASSKKARLEGEAAAKAELMKNVQPLMASEDMKEGVASFLERREAKFTGR